MCIDLKSFYASVECVLRGLDPFEVNLVVADKERGGGSIVLAVSPHLKKFGVPSRCRIYELPTDMDIIYAKPRMKKYIEFSSRIYDIYLKYIAKEDIHVYSIDEAFMDFTSYMNYYNMPLSSIGRMILDDIFKTTGITATCGMGDNMFLAKVALDCLAKHSPDYMSYLNQELF
jgi:DNA polymerase V